MTSKGTDNHPHPLIFYISGGNTKCSLCGNDIDEGLWFYFCSECSLRLHLRCGEHIEFPNKNRQEIETREMASKGTRVRDSHKHPLTVHGLISGNPKCHLCRNNIDKGSWYYKCSQCSYHLHVHCGEQLKFVSLSSDLHPLELLRLDNIICHYCEKSYQNTLMYTCKECSVHIHQKCLAIPLPTISCDNVDHAQYICHDRPMTLVEHDGKYDRVIRHCLACQAPWSSDLAYTCQKSCENFLHKTCEELPQKIERPSYHMHHSLKLQFCQPHQSCSACNKRGGKLMYFCCEEGCNFVLGTECVFLTPTMRWERDDYHFLFLIERAYCGIDQDCYFCRNSYEKQLVKDEDEVIHTQSFLFHCFECNFNIHFLCGPLPSRIKHECHIHFLHLKDFIDDDDDYCDICEKKRNPRFRVYYCAKCKYVAHIQCVILEVIKVLKGRPSPTNVKTLAVGETRWKEAAGEDPTNIYQLLRWTRKKTVGDIMEKLTDEERMKLLNPYGDSSTFVKGLYDTAREENSRRYERKDDTEDIDRIQNLFNICHSDIESYKDELWYFNSEEGLKLDERYLKMKVVDVEGYEVPRSLAPVLRRVLRKYGDIGRNSSLRPEMKSIACTFLCILLQRMSMTNFEDITKDVLKDWFFYHHSIRIITGFRLKFLKKQLHRLVCSFVGFEAIKFQKEMAERLQLQLETSKANLEKLKGIGESTASDGMKECLRRGSKFKWKDACEGLF